MNEYQRRYFFQARYFLTIVCELKDAAPDGTPLKSAHFVKSSEGTIALLQGTRGLLYTKIKDIYVLAKRNNELVYIKSTKGFSIIIHGMARILGVQGDELRGILTRSG